MNYFVYNMLSALSYNISKESFLMAKKWYKTGLFLDVVSIFALPSFKALDKVSKKVIYDKINELFVSAKDLEEKKAWLVICRKQLANTCLEEKSIILRVREKFRRK